MSTVEIFPVYFCRLCAGHQALSAGFRVAAACPKCGFCDSHPEDSLFDRDEWERSDRPGAMLVCLRVVGVAISARKQRLARCAQTRVGYANCRDPRYHDALACSEEWADAGVEPPLAKEMRRHLHSVRWMREGRNFWADAAAECLSDRFNDTWSAPSDVIPTRASAVREVFANPFLQLTWNPDWLTSTVRDLAAHIYEQREFHLMPILGDALMDAGCDHQLIQDHCRTTKPHARGCWIVDAILGKS